ncbi:MAG: hypothetical protein ACI8W7_000812 [Gammaproteobacteria bacterium]|jgi:hypothetical protein
MIARFRGMSAVQKSAAVHASTDNPFNLERHLKGP